MAKSNSLQGELFCKVRFGWTLFLCHKKISFGGTMTPCRQYNLWNSWHQEAVLSDLPTHTVDINFTHRLRLRMTHKWPLTKLKNFLTFRLLQGLGYLGIRINPPFIILVSFRSILLSGNLQGRFRQISLVLSPTHSLSWNCLYPQIHHNPITLIDCRDAGYTSTLTDIKRCAGSCSLPWSYMELNFQFLIKYPHPYSPILLPVIRAVFVHG